MSRDSKAIDETYLKRVSEESTVNKTGENGDSETTKMNDTSFGGGGADDDQHNQD